MGTRTSRDLNDVLVFTSVVEAGSFTAAARAMSIPVSTVSRRVSRLEESLGVRLLQRTTRKLSLTDAGQLYYDRGVQVFAGLEEVENILAEAQSTPKGRVRVSAPSEHSITMTLVSGFVDAFPEVRVDLALSSRPVNLIEEGYDASIVAGPLTNLSVVAHKLVDSSFRLVASPSYLERRGAPEDASQLSDHECVIFGANSDKAHWDLTGLRGPVRVAIRGRVAVNHLQAVRAAARAGHGIALLPTIVCGADIRDGRLQVVLPGVAPPPIPLYITYPAGRFIAPALRAFVDYVKVNFPSLVEAQLGEPSTSGV